MGEKKSNTTVRSISELEKALGPGPLFPILRLFGNAIQVVGSGNFYPFYTPPKIGSGEPQIDLNGTKDTKNEGSAKNDEISLPKADLPHYRKLNCRGVALTDSQKIVTGVHLNDEVIVRDTITGRKTFALQYDNAVFKWDGLSHIEMSPALTDYFRITKPNKDGGHLNSIHRSENMVGRFEVIPAPAVSGKIQLDKIKEIGKKQAQMEKTLKTIEQQLEKTVKSMNPFAR